MPSTRRELRPAGPRRSRRTPGRPAPPRISRARSARKLAKKSPSPSAHPGVAADHRRPARTRRSRRARRRPRSPRPRVGARAALAVQRWRRTRRRDPLPAVVAVHRVEAPRSPWRSARPSGSAASSSAIWPRRALRRHVAPVEEGVDRHRHARPRRSRGAAAAMWRWCACTPPCEARPSEVRGAPAGLERRDEGLRAPGCAAKLAVLDGVVDARRSIHTTRPAPMLVCPTSELPIWPVGQPHVGAVGARAGVRAGRPDAGRSWACRPSATALPSRDRAEAPAIQNAQHDRPHPRLPPVRRQE